ncbi:MAG: hypothetical protein GX767_07305 [Firmicutes bacterium]|nr:hypothetical protein [Bacillota bacterium]
MPGNEKYSINARGISRRKQVLKGSRSVYDLSQVPLNLSEKEYNERKIAYLKWAKMG